MVRKAIHGNNVLNDVSNGFYTPNRIHNVHADTNPTRYGYNKQNGFLFWIHKTKNTSERPVYFGRYTTTVLTPPSHDRRRNGGLGRLTTRTMTIKYGLCSVNTDSRLISYAENDKPPIFDGRVFRGLGDPVTQPGRVVLQSSSPPTLLSCVNSIYDSINGMFI